jgi:hypothetical protein
MMALLQDFDSVLQAFDVELHWQAFDVELHWQYFDAE